MAKTNIRRLVNPQPRAYERFLDVSRRRLSQRGPLSIARRRVPLLVLRTCEAHFYSGLLEMGTLHPARFNDDGAGEWLPLPSIQGLLTSANGLASQADILINTRRTANRLGAIRVEALDRIAANAINGKLYCAMTHIFPRTRERVAHMKRHRADYNGQIIECTEDNAEATAETFTWALFHRWGGPSDGADSAYFAGLNPHLISPVSSPHQVAFGLSNNLWVAAADQASASRTSDALYAVRVAGSEWGHLRQFLSSVPAGTIAGLTFTPNNPPSFVPSSIQGKVPTSRIHRAPGPSGPSPHDPV
jgi:secreted PhoX family phosphatase